MLAQAAIPSPLASLAEHLDANIFMSWIVNSFWEHHVSYPFLVATNREHNTSSRLADPCLCLSNETSCFLFLLEVLSAFYWVSKHGSDVQFILTVLYWKKSSSMPI